MVNNATSLELRFKNIISQSISQSKTKTDGFLFLGENLENLLSLTHNWNEKPKKDQLFQGRYDSTIKERVSAFARSWWLFIPLYLIIIYAS